MDIPIDQDQHWLIDCLKASMEPYKDRRSFAETSLHQAALQPGFGTALVRVAANREINNDLRQISFLLSFYNWILLIAFVKQHWKVDDDGFIHPVASPTEKATIRQLLMLSMDDRIKRIRTVIAMVVTLIVNYDWPEEWPELLPHLLKLISDQTNVNGVHGGLKCLSIIAEDLDDKLVTKLVFVFFPYLHAIVSSPKLYDECLRVKAISIFHSCISILGSMTAVFKVETDEIMTSLLRSWTPQFLLILETPLHPKKPDGWDIKMVVLKCLMQLIQSFPTKAETEFVVVVASFWKTFASCSNIYVLSSVQGDEDPYMACDSDGSDKNIEMFAVQLLELLQTAIQNSKLAQVIGSELDDLLYYVIAFLQMTEHQVYKWSHDVNEYVADEDDATYDCRVSGSFLLEGIVHVFGTKGINSLIKASVTHYKNSCESKLKGSIYWWQVHEACLFALSSIADSLLEEQSSGLNTEGLTTLLHQMLMEDKEIGHTYPFLHARAFVTVAKFSTMINDSLKEHFIYAAVQAISTNTPPPVKADACQALIHLLPESKPEFIQVHIIGLLSSLSDLLNQATEETLHLVLETLQAAVKAGREQSASIEPILSPIVLNKWVQVVSDPFISIDALDVLEEIKNAPGCFRSFASRILPSIASILEQPLHQPEGLIAGSFDLLSMLLKNAPTDVVNAVFDTCFISVIRIILQSNDHSEMQVFYLYYDHIRFLILGFWSDPPQITNKILKC
ncbi:Importin beta-2 subunit family protein [Zostera marina]|uniref:Importin beta-2 subunit family protein n=1 Tax=Zostera marina TaxID=29655 RepID=A0A0K9PQA9_ZOSMR|nr:Importin beta-2 subunit family protein [Zostera marina]